MENILKQQKTKKKSVGKPILAIYSPGHRKMEFPQLHSKNKPHRHGKVETEPDQWTNSVKKQKNMLATQVAQKTFDGLNSTNRQNPPNQ